MIKTEAVVLVDVTISSPPPAGGGVNYTYLLLVCKDVRGGTKNKKQKTDQKNTSWEIVHLQTRHPVRLTIKK